MALALKAAKGRCEMSLNLQGHRNTLIAATAALYRAVRTGDRNAIRDASGKRLDALDAFMAAFPDDAVALNLQLDPPD
jgi:hypothetical protein